MGRDQLSKAMQNEQVHDSTAAVADGLRSRMKIASTSPKKRPTVSTGDNQVLVNSMGVIKKELAKMENILVLKATQGESATKPEVDTAAGGLLKKSRKLKKRRPARAQRHRRVKGTALEPPKNLQDELSNYFKPTNAKRR